MKIKIFKKLGRIFLSENVRKALKERRTLNKLKTLSSDLPYKFIIHHKKNHNDHLSVLCDKWGSDKGGIKKANRSYSWEPHTYTDFYSHIFSHCRNDILRVFECGIGTNNPKLRSSMGTKGSPGASLRVWRDYFPNAMIIGADIDRDILFKEKRIKTFFIDQLNPKVISNFWKTISLSDFDLIIDDGLHTFEAGICLFKNSIKHLSNEGIYVIEDVSIPDLFRYKDFFIKTNYILEYVTMFRPNHEINDNNLIVIRKP